MAKRSTGKAAPAVGAPPPFRPAQLAPLVDTASTASRWFHEVQYKGYRVLLRVGGADPCDYSHSSLEWSDRFTGVIVDQAKLNRTCAFVDGEALGPDKAGRSSFQALRNALNGAPASIDYSAIDLLKLNGDKLTQLPLVKREAIRDGQELYIRAGLKALGGWGRAGQVLPDL